MSAPPVAPRDFGTFMPTLRHENDEWSKGGTAVSITFLNGIAWRRHQCWVRISPWAMFFNGMNHQKASQTYLKFECDAIAASGDSLRRKREGVAVPGSPG